MIIPRMTPKTPIRAESSQMASVAIPIIMNIINNLNIDISYFTYNKMSIS